jgi:crotonobetainyl-CoA:carnitine CoA-transferase CaiB-like acyl-CoA transferase
MSELPLSGLRVIDCATVVAGPRIAMYLGDFGADVIKVEHPERGDDTRHFGAERDGVSMYWKLVSRNNHDAALAPLYDVSEFMDDPHVRKRGSIATVDDPDWGPVRMQAVHPGMSATPGRIDRPGAGRLGADNSDVYGELGLTADELDRLKEMGAI